jgi:type II secretion system protein D
MNLRTSILLNLLLGLGILAMPSLSLANGRPDPKPATTVADTDADEAPDAPVHVVAADADEDIEVIGNDELREMATHIDPFRPNSLFNNGERAIFNVKDMSVEELVPIIAQLTNKVVMPINMQTLRTAKVTIVTNAPIEKSKVIDLIFANMKFSRVGVLETPEVIIIDQLDHLNSISQPPVLTADEDVMTRQDVASVIIKIFRLENINADDVSQQLQELKPEDATITVDPNSNQIVVRGSVQYCQQLNVIIKELDNNPIKIETQVFQLQHADASEIEGNILDLFEPDGSASNTRNQTRTRRTANTPASNVLGPGPQAELRVTVNVQTNTVTVKGDPRVIQQISKLVSEYWDVPRPEGTAKVYRLQYTDPVVIRNTLQELLGQGGGISSRGGARGATGQRTDVSEALGGIYQIEAIPDINALMVFCKTEASFGFLDSVINELDQKTLTGVPVFVELKHANAVSLAEELNVLLAPAGANAQLQRPASGLTAQGLEDSNAATTDQQQGGNTAITFPWQSGRGNDEASDPSALIGTVRLVPIVRQNAIAVLAPPWRQEQIIEVINQFDRPGRQVMISAVIAEVELVDDLALGIRLSSDAIPVSNSDNLIRFGGDIAATENNLLGSLFDTSVLSANIPVNMVIQALNQKTNVRIIQEPRVFTSDNEEAAFFDGQEIPFIEDTVTNASTTTQSVRYRDVGVLLNVRPRITVERDVDIEIRLILSSVVQGQTLAGSAIIDKRETTTRLVVKNGQTLMISGILRDEESEITRGIPLLSDIPIIGELFKSRENQTRTTELVAFITPLVVDGPHENDTNFQSESVKILEHLAKPVRDLAEERRQNPEGVVNDVVDIRRKLEEQRVIEDQKEADSTGASTDDAPIDIDDLDG